jgi:hypothetical protein
MSMMSVRVNNKVETRMVSDYVFQVYGKYPHMLGVPLGKIETSLMTTYGVAKAIAMSRPYRPEVDAVVILPGAMILIEAKVWNVINGLSKLPLYKSLVPFTPELERYKSLPILMEVVVGWTNDNLEIQAKEIGVAVKVFTPDYVSEAVNGLHKYWTAEYRQKRAQKLALREYFGVE